MQTLLLTTTYEGAGRVLQSESFTEASGLTGCGLDNQHLTESLLWEKQTYFPCSVKETNLNYFEVYFWIVGIQ